MGFPAYLITNRLDSSVTFSSNTEDTTFPHERLFDVILANPFQWTDDLSGGGSIWVEFDFGSAPSADTFAILNHNFTSGASVVLKSGASPTPTVTLATVTWAEFDMYTTFADPAHRYYRLEITDTFLDDTAPMIGEIIIGDRVTLTSRMSFGFSKSLDHGKVHHETNAGVDWIYSQFDRRIFEAQFTGIQNPHVAELNALDQAVVGSKIPWVWIPNLSDAECYFVRKEDLYQVQSIAYNAWDVTLTLREESRGGFVSL